MNVAALPYTLLLILAELSIGSLWVTLASDLRGGVTRGFVMTMALCVAISAGLTYWVASGVTVGADVDGYRVDSDWFDPAKRALIVVIVTSTLYMFSAFMGWDAIGRFAGIAGAIAGALVVGCLAAMLAPPTWGYPGELLALIAGTMALGAVSVSMVWGHWYLTEGSLPAWPLRDLAWILIAALGFQAAVVLDQPRDPRAQHTDTGEPGRCRHLRQPRALPAAGRGYRVPRDPRHPLFEDDEAARHAERHGAALHLHGRRVRRRSARQGAHVPHRPPRLGWRSSIRCYRRSKPNRSEIGP